jgi:methanogenic corrinoid protein MtbC1
LADASVIFDPELYLRSTSRFAQKRSYLAPAAVERLARDVLTRLSRPETRVAPECDPDISAARLDAFCDVLIQRDARAAQEFITARRAEGVTRMEVYFGYISAAATRLGTRWDKSELSFMDVTIATGHLYALMRALRAETPIDPRRFDDRRNALFATVPGETHGLGVTVAADYFRAHGWQIDLQIARDLDALIHHAKATAPRVIGLSLSSEDHLDTLAQLVVALRLAVPQSIIGVAPAGGLVTDAIRDLIDVDLVFTTARDALIDLEHLIDGHSLSCFASAR